MSKCIGRSELSKVWLAQITVGSFLFMTGVNSGAERTCAGEFTDMRVIGITIGNCDLNSISEKDLKGITDICGQPGSIDDNEKTKCRVRALVSAQKSTPSGNHGYRASVYIVRKILQVYKK